MTLMHRETGHEGPQPSIDKSRLCQDAFIVERWAGMALHGTSACRHIQLNVGRRYHARS